MKKIIFFDIDNTLVDSSNGKIHTQTRKLLDELSKDDRYYLGIATGRGPGRLYVIEDVLHFFDVIIYSNGSYITFQDKVIYQKTFTKEELENIINITSKFKLVIGASGLKEDILLRGDEDIQVNMRNKAKVNPNYYLAKDVYQLWFVSNDRSILKEAISLLPNYGHFFWTGIGVDVSLKGHSKGTGILRVKDVLSISKVISVGDGHNDIDMIEVADIGIAMGNTKHYELKEKADYVGPCVTEDKLYDFLKENNII